MINLVLFSICLISAVILLLRGDYFGFALFLLIVAWFVHVGYFERK